ncbi:MAG: DNA polymerase III subunit gamma/tau [Bdellovibrionales bacterium]
MSYEVIARRWRPQDFSGLIGQDHIRITLTNALKSGRIHQSLLFTGPRGTGKTSSARILAKALRCPNAVDFVPCGKCSDCEEIATGRSVDVVEIDGASHNGVDSIRELRETVGFLPSSGKVKVYIIDEVHMLSTSAFNALLKTLEEPPEHVYFIMATTEVQKIPATILSRCQRFDFRRIPTRVIAQHLTTICERDGVTFEPEALWLIARQGDGSMRDSQSLLDQVINFTGGQLKREEVVGTLGLTNRGLLMSVISAVFSKDPRAMLKCIAGLHESGGDPKLFLLDLLEQIRNALFLKMEGESSFLDIPDSEQEELIRLGESLSGEDLHWFFDMALKGVQDLSRSNDPLLVLEMVLMRMAAAPRVSELGAVMVGAAPEATPSPANQISTNPPRTRTDGVSDAPQGPGSYQSAQPSRLQFQRPPPPRTERPAAEAPTPSAPVSPATTQPARPPQFQELVAKIKEVNGLLAAQLENCFVVSLAHQKLVLGVEPRHKFLFDKINQPDFKKKVLNYMGSYWGPGYSLDVTLGSADSGAELSPKAKAQKSEEDRRQAERDLVEAHPLVQSAKQIFNAEIKTIKELKP